MTQDDGMTIAEQINEQISAGRKAIEKSWDDVREMEMPDLPPAAVAAGVVAAVMAAGVLGWLIYRSRRRKSVAQRLQDALPDRVRDLPENIRELRRSR